jgi:hypothetical protein
MSKSFFNTINLEGPALEKATARAAYQNDLIIAIFRQNPSRRFSPSQMQKIISAKYGRHLIITSVRRSMTTLTDRGSLTKGDDAQRIAGPNGVPENTWAYNEAGDTKALEGFLEDLQEGRLENREKCDPVSSNVSPQTEKATRQAAPPTPKGFIQQALFAY